MGIIQYVDGDPHHQLPEEEEGEGSNLREAKGVSTLLHQSRSSIGVVVRQAELNLLLSFHHSEVFNLFHSRDGEEREDREGASYGNTYLRDLHADGDFW